MKASVAATVSGLAARAVLVLLLLGASIFLVSALNNYLHTLWGPVGANLAMAGGFFVAAVVVAMVIAARRSTRAGETSQPVARSAAQNEPTAPSGGGIDGTLRQAAARLALSPRDTEIALTVAKAAVPIVLPRVLKLAMRNLPAVGVAAAAIYLASRYGTKSPDAGRDS